MWKGHQYLVAIVLGFCLIFSLELPLFAAKSREEKPRSGGVLRVKPFTNIFRTELDPLKNPHYFIIEHIYDGLVRLEQNLNIVPCLAEYWEISGDGRRYTFYLRKGVKFHHGKELTAEDVKFSLERLIGKKGSSAYYQYFTTRVVGAQEYWEGKTEEVAGFRVLDKYTFEIQWKNPYVSSLYLMSMYFCKILPKDLVLSQGENFFFKPSGTGPFKFAYWIRSPQLEILGVRLERNNQYFGPIAYLEAVEYSPNFTLDHFFEREIDIIPFLSERLLKTNCQIIEDNSFHLTFLALSCLVPPLDRPAVRQALSYGLDKKKIAQAAYAVDSIPQVTNNYIPAKLPGFFPDDKDNHDLKKAQEILEKEGLWGEKKFPTLTLFLKLPKMESQIKLYRELEDELDLLGIKLRLRYYKSSEEIRAFKEPYLVIIRWMMDFPDPDNVISPLFSSKSISNLAQYSNPQLDKLLEEASIERSWTRRIELFHEIEKILYSDIPMIPLYSDRLKMALQPYVRGVRIPPLGFYYLDAKEIWLEK